MKNIIKWFGIIAFAAIIGFSMMACGDEEQDQKVIVKNLSTYTQDNPVTMVLIKMSAAPGVYLAGPRQIAKDQQWEVSGCPVGESLMVVVLDSGGLGFGTMPFTLSAGQTKTLTYKGGGTYAPGGDDFTVGD
ncbi:MAG: hypothetical protein LBH20_06750 [Treponema sp.]|jgi:hypothetical protein|nr:hypothetical protein [Treponema sp.]